MSSPLPLLLLQPACNLAMEAVRRAHPLMFRRMREKEGAWFNIVPDDFPFAFSLHASCFSPRLVAYRKRGRRPAAAATISAPVKGFLDLLSGKSDGDAMFFGRGLRITGDMEAVLALRNAIEAADVNPFNDLAALMGPLMPCKKSLNS